VKLVSKEFNGMDKMSLGDEQRKVKVLGLRFGKRKVSSFGTSPGFFSGNFVNQCSAFYDWADLDPEKQQRTHLNPALMNFTSRYECRVLPGTEQPEIILT